VELFFAALDIVFFSKPFDTSGSVNELLLSGKEGMAS
jgi:hypothetical protein